MIRMHRSIFSNIYYSICQKYSGFNILFLALLLFVFTNTVSAQVTCKENVMTTNRFCSSKAELVGANYYFFATDDTGAEAKILFNFGGLNSASYPDGVMIKLDDGAPFKVTASAPRPDVNCRGYGGCKWSVRAFANITNVQFDQIANSSRMLVSYTQGVYVSEPIEVDPKKIGAWFQQWTAMTKGMPTSKP